MKNIIIGIIIGMLLAGGIVYAGTDINVEALWNRVFDSSTDTIRVIGQ